MGGARMKVAPSHQPSLHITKTRRGPAGTKMVIGGDRFPMHAQRPTGSRGIFD
jgi:hypothetical protein